VILPEVQLLADKGYQEINRHHKASIISQKTNSQNILNLNKERKIVKKQKSE
jgi:hypothetical protein